MPRGYASFQPLFIADAARGPALAGLGEDLSNPKICPPLEGVHARLSSTLINKYSFQPCETQATVSSSGVAYMPGAYGVPGYSLQTGPTIVNVSGAAQAAASAIPGVTGPLLEAVDAVPMSWWKIAAIAVGGILLLRKGS